MGKIVHIYIVFNKFIFTKIEIKYCSYHPNEK